MIVTAFTWLAAGLALVGFAIIAEAQFKNSWMRILHELEGFRWIAAAAFIALMAAIMHVAKQVF